MQWNDTILLDTLKDRFGFDGFRPGQREAIQALLQHQRLLCIQPTGHGKSLLYQLPACLFSGLTLVVSPLLALMRDQIDQLNDRFDIPAASINSDQSDDENRAACIAARDGRLKILFVSPEQLDRLETYRFLVTLPINLLVIDEAHCISTWGHDFRPAYRAIVDTLRDLEQKIPDVHVLALTATANERTEADIKRQIELDSGTPLVVHRQSMDRPNLSLDVAPVRGLAEKLAVLETFIRETPGHGLIYCATRQSAEVVGEYLTSVGLNVASYHAGMDAIVKRRLQKGFMQGTYRAIAATNALGMGIDKTDLRYVVHADTPGSITAYYQEVGRAGRDGEPAKGLLLFDRGDQKIHDYFINAAQPTLPDFQAVLDAIPDESAVANGAEAPTLMAIKVDTGLHPTRVTVILAELREQGFIEKRLIDKRQRYVRLPTAGEPSLDRYRTQREVRQGELDAMMAYGSGPVDCSMQTLRRALGDPDAPSCGRCSRCQGTTRTAPSPELISAAALWLTQRPHPIPAKKRDNIEQGLALLSSEHRSPAFLQFMKHRATPYGPDHPLHPDNNEAFREALECGLRHLKQAGPFTGLVALPSSSWVGREAFAQLISERLDLPVFTDLLEWSEPPPSRQGELLNNDQRKQNVANRMSVNIDAKLPASGRLILFDDYWGSAHTLREASRALRARIGRNVKFVPFTIVQVKWRLGRPGIV